MAEKTARTVASIITGIGLAIGAGLAFVVWLIAADNPRLGFPPVGLRMYLLTGAWAGLTISLPMAWLVTGSTKSTDPVEEPREPSKLAIQEEQATAEWLDDLR